MTEETARKIRFLITGGMVACIYVTGFTLLYTFGLSPLNANLIAFSFSVVIQYIMQTRWTFRRPLLAGAQTVRFAVIIIIGLIYSSVVASYVGPTLNWPPWVSAIAISVTLPIINYISFRLWVYGPE